MPELTSEPGPALGSFEIVFDETRPIRKPAVARRAGVTSIACLTAQKATGSDLERFNGKVSAIPTNDTQRLILRIATTDDPLVLWALHGELDLRNVPPCLRWPANTDAPQADFITWMADLLWLCKRYPDHQPKFQGWRRLFTDTANSPVWCERAFWLYDRTAGRSVAHITAKALALSEAQRQNLMSLPTAGMVKHRRELHPEREQSVRCALLTHAMHHRDKRPGGPKPEAIAHRRADIRRTHILMGFHPTATAQVWQLLTGTPTTRQAISKQIATTDEVLRVALKMGDLEHHSYAVYLR